MFTADRFTATNDAWQGSSLVRTAPRVRVPVPGSGRCRAPRSVRRMPEPTIVAIDWSGAKGEGRQPRHLGHRDARRRGRRRPRQLVARATRSTSSSRNRLPSSPASTSRSASRRGSRASSVARRSTTCGRRRDRRRAPGSRRRRRSGTPVRAPDERSGSARARRGCAAGFPAEVGVPTGRQRQVGAGSVRGMPHLARLRADGLRDLAVRRRARPRSWSRSIRRCCADGSRTSTTVPRPRTTRARRTRVPPGPWGARAEEFTRLVAAADPVTRIEGDVWMPAATSP